MSFGKRGQGEGRFSAVQRQPAGNAPLQRAAAPVAPRQSPHTIYRAGETERPTFHDSFVEKHWPKALGVVAAAFALGYLIYDGKRDLFGLVLVPLLFGGFAYLAGNRFRKSLNNLHIARTQLFRSPAFLVGGAVGLAYFVYSTFVAPETIMGQEWGVQTAFADGFQQQDLSAVAMLLLKAVGLVVLGGFIVEAISKRLFGGTGGGSQD